VKTLIRDYYPRYLSVREFINPYLVFEKFFKYRDLEEWKDDLYEVVEYASSISLC
jgi:hypothetical protein